MDTEKRGQIPRARKSVPLTDEQLVGIERARTPGTPEHEALVALTGVDPVGSSETQILLALFDLGYQVFREALLEAGYRQLAAEETAEDRQARRMLRDRLLARGSGE